MKMKMQTLKIFISVHVYVILSGMPSICSVDKNVNILSVLGSKFENRIELEVKPLTFVRFSISFHMLPMLCHI